MVVTWNPSNKTSGVTLSNGNLTFAATTQNQGGKANAAYTTGKYYWEVLFEGYEIEVGVAKSTWDLTITGFSETNTALQNRHMLMSFGEAIRPPSNTGFNQSANLDLGTLIGVAVDLNAGKVWFALDGVWQPNGTGVGDPETGANPAASWSPTGTWLASYFMQTTGRPPPPSPQGTANFGATPFAHAIPVGFLSYDLSQDGSTPPVETTPVGSSLPVSWAVRNAVGDSLSVAWGVRNAVGDSQALSWAVRALVGDSQPLSWDVRGLAGDSLTVAWQIIISILATPGEYDGAVALAERLIAKKGRPVIIRRFLGANTPDAAKPWRVNPSGVNDHQAFAVFLDYEQRDIDGTKIKREDKRLLVAASGLLIEPNPRDQVWDGGGTVKYDVIDVKPLKPGQQNILYEIQVRR